MLIAQYASTMHILLYLIIIWIHFAKNDAKPEQPQPTRQHPIQILHAVFVKPHCKNRKTQPYFPLSVFGEKKVGLGFYYNTYNVL